MRLRGTKYILNGLSLLLLVTTDACKKEKINFTYDNTPVEHGPSAARVVNLGDYYSQVVANGDSLTNFKEPGKGTDYFPLNGMLGRSWWIPNDLFASGKVDLDLWGAESDNVYTDEGTSRAHFTLPDPKGKKVDYYTIRPYGTGQPFVVPIERDDTPPVAPTKFKIRMINLMKTFPGLRYPGPLGNRENLYGAVTLCFADGTPVDPKTSNITLGDQVSDYVEVPYGTYQFKVLTADGRQISAFNLDGQPLSMDPTLSTVQVYSTYNPTRSTYAPVQTYQPGGVYSLVVSPVVFGYAIPGPPYYVNMVQNGFCVIEDNVIQENTEFGRVQAVNALAGTTVSVRLNGKTLANKLTFGAQSDYSTLTAGSYTAEVVDQKGAVLATQALDLEPAQNITFWLYPDTGEQPTLLPVVNDLSGQVYDNRNNDDGSVNRVNYEMAFGTRFLNLSPDVDNLNFTIQNGQNVLDDPFSTAYGLIAIYLKHNRNVMYDLKPGYVATDLPYVWWNYNMDLPFQFMAFRSKPGISPGDWISEIPSLSSANFVQRSELYTKVNRDVPPYEAGIYTIALIGRLGDGVPEEDQARILYVKHTK